MSEFRDEALKKLREGAKNVKGQKETAMKEAVRATLETFCTQNEEFAQAVVQGGSFSDCMAAVAKGVGGSISDLEAYRKAVQFYFPGAEIRMQRTIDLIGAADAKIAAEWAGKGFCITPNLCLEAVNAIEELTGRNVGKWLFWQDDPDANVYECSACHEPLTLNEGTPRENNFNFCPFCGLPMKEGDDDV